MNGPIRPLWVSSSLSASYQLIGRFQPQAVGAGSVFTLRVRLSRSETAILE